MPFLYINQGGSGSGGGGGDITFTDGTLTISTAQTSTDFTVPAGKWRVRMKNVGPAGGGAMATATVNGQPLFMERTVEFQSETDWTNKQVLKTPEITVVTNGATIWMEVTE
jgi:hypothetical protein